MTSVVEDLVQRNEGLAAELAGLRGLFQELLVQRRGAVVEEYLIVRLRLLQLQAALGRREEIVFHPRHPVRGGERLRPFANQQHVRALLQHQPRRQDRVAQMLNAGNRPGVQAVPTTLAGVRQMIKALRKGMAVGLLPDQVPPEGQGVWSPFFGRDAYTMTLAARLALQTGAAVIVARCERLSWGRGYALYLEELPVPLSENLEAAVQQINEAMEHTIRQCPQQYLWGYARYKQPRREAPANEVHA